MKYTESIDKEIRGTGSNLLAMSQYTCVKDGFHRDMATAFNKKVRCYFVSIAPALLF